MYCVNGSGGLKFSIEPSIQLARDFLFPIGSPSAQGFFFDLMERRLDRHNVIFGLDSDL